MASGIPQGNADKALPGIIPASSLDQFNYVLSEICDQMMHLVIVFDKCPDEELLREAFRISFDLAPVLGCRFCEGEPPFWEPIRGLDADSWFRVHTTSDTDQELRRVLTEPIDSESGPQVRLDLIRYGPGTGTLCISMHHAASDAHGLLVYTGLLAGLYREMPGAGRVPGSGILAQDRSLDRYLSRFSPAEQEKAAARVRPATDLWSFPYRSLACGNRDFAFRFLAPGNLEAIRAYGRARSATINDLLLSAVFLALLETAQPAYGRMLPVLHSLDLRRHVPGTPGFLAIPGQIHSDRPDCDICNLSVAFNVILPSGVDRSMDAILPLVQEAMRMHKETNSGLFSALETEALARQGFAAFREHVGFMKETAIRNGGNCPFFSNIGVLPDESLDFGPGLTVSRAFVAGMVEYPPGIVLAASTFAGSLTFAMGYCADAVFRESATGFLDAIIRYLPAPRDPDTG
ncbi:MAG: hypothetical protein ABFC24_06855 [Methanoregulaceae archaeon]